MPKSNTNKEFNRSRIYIHSAMTSDANAEYCEYKNTATQQLEVFTLNVNYLMLMYNLQMESKRL